MYLKGPTYEEVTDKKWRMFDNPKLSCIYSSFSSFTLAFLCIVANAQSRLSASS